MEETWIIILQLLVVTSVVGGILLWVVRGLLYKSLQDTTDKVIVITGCDTGIGHELAVHLDSLGFTVVAGCLSTSSEGAQRLRVEASSRLHLIPLDVRKEEQVKLALQYVEQHLCVGETGVYAVVNNAGVCVCGEFDWQTWGQVESQVQTNLLGTLRVTKLFLPLLKRAGGRVINVSSVAGLHGYPGLSVYCATKHALEGFTHVLRLELLKLGVHVVSVQPGDFSKATHLLDSHHNNMNLMWGEMSEHTRQEYKHFFLAYHDKVARQGFTGRRVKPLSVLPNSLLRAFDEALMAKVPNTSYLVMPTLRSRLKLWLVGVLPKGWGDRILHIRYQKSLPALSKVTC